MIDRSFVPIDGHPDAADRTSFTGSHRAFAVCTRELERLTSEVVRQVTALSMLGVEQTAKVRLSPARCIVQLGPVALTVGWLRRGLDSVAEGQLLVIVWRGVVAPPWEDVPERVKPTHGPVAATPLWEEVLIAVGTSEESWAWQPIDAGSGGHSSAELATRCVERLRRAYDDWTLPAPAEKHASS